MIYDLLIAGRVLVHGKFCVSIRFCVGAREDAGSVAVSWLGYGTMDLLWLVGVGAGGGGSCKIVVPFSGMAECCLMGLLMLGCRNLLNLLWLCRANFFIPDAFLTCMFAAVLFVAGCLLGRGFGSMGRCMTSRVAARLLIVGFRHDASKAYV